MDSQNFNNTNFGGAPQEPDELTGIMVVACCIPIVGLIIWATSREKYPNKAKKAITMAIIGFAVIMVLNILLTMAGAALR